MPPRKGRKSTKQLIATKLDNSDNVSVKSDASRSTRSGSQSEEGIPPSKRSKTENGGNQKKSRSESSDVKGVDLSTDYYKALRKITAPGRVLTVGQGDVGQLGLGEDVLEKKFPQPVGGELEGKEVVKVVCGGMHTVCLTADGKIYTWGCNDEGALGRKVDEGGEFLPGLVTDLDKVRIVQVSAGDSHTAALTANGEVYVCGVFRDSNGPFGLITSSPSSSPQLIYKSPSDPVVKIASGSDHLIFLTISGEVMSLGCGEQGQLGRIAERFAFRGGRKGITALLIPSVVKVKRTRGVKPKFADIFCGSYHTFAVAMETQQVYAWGLNNYGQLGTGDVNNRFMPEILPPSWQVLMKEELSDISGGQHHTILSTKKGKVYAIGRTEYGRLGLGENPEEPHTPVVIDSLSNVVSITAGACVSFAVQDTGQACGWGMGTNLQLSSGCEEDDQLVPVLMKGKKIENKKVISIASGGQHTALLVQE